MPNNKKNKNRIWEVVIVNGVKYVKDALSSSALASKLAIRGSKVNTVSSKFLSVKTGSKYYF